MFELLELDHSVYGVAVAGPSADILAFFHSRQRVIYTDLTSAGTQRPPGEVCN